ncbi:hypothetical protein PR048_007533 [Dryococelus australis]|uniref:Uncharacterized protein n=1 Tax=Dryococelus australis TaxID=614101 RepID=A0ABQ9HUH3_9NEOP|nr:hypothetical protein PR048_007533 [Dryococelus australis]
MDACLHGPSPSIKARRCELPTTVHIAHRRRSDTLTLPPWPLSSLHCWRWWRSPRPPLNHARRQLLRGGVSSAYQLLSGSSCVAAHCSRELSPGSSRRSSSHTDYSSRMVSYSSHEVLLKSYSQDIPRRHASKTQQSVENYATRTTYRIRVHSEAKDGGLVESMARLMSGQDVTVELPGGVETTLSPRGLDDGEVALKLRLDSSEAARRRKKKSKLRKLIVPLAVLLALKALTLIPLFLGLLGIKAFNALQLGFGSFVVSFGLAIFQLAKKLMGDSMPPLPLTPIAAPQPLVAAPSGWDRRSAHDSAYSAHMPASR